MSYTITRTNGAQVAIVADGTIDATLDLKLIGKNYAGYGAVQNENFVYLLENFASNNPPPRAISGQIWFDSSASKLKFYDGVKFRTTGGAEISATAPTGLTVGDFQQIIQKAKRSFLGICSFFGHLQLAYWYESSNAQAAFCGKPNSVQFRWYDG